MRLLEIESDEEQDVINQQSMDFLQKYGNDSSLWINGKWSNYEKMWLTYPDNYKTLFNLRVPEKKYDDDEYCLAVVSSNEIDFVGIACDDSNFYYCEF